MIKVFKLVPEAIVPSYATESSACFDIHACITADSQIKALVTDQRAFFNVVSEQEILLRPKNSEQKIILPPQSRALIPTGLIFDIPIGHSLRLHPRSGLAFKNGIALANSEGVVDEDYVNQVYVAVINHSDVDFTISHGDRICQAELVKDLRIEIQEILEKPTIKTTRVGGFGSTGV